MPSVVLVTEPQAAAISYSSQSRVEPGAVVTDSLIGSRARVGERSVLTGAVVGDGAVVGADNELREGVRVWCDALIPAGAVRFSSDQ